MAEGDGAHALYRVTRLPPGEPHPGKSAVDALLEANADLKKRNDKLEKQVTDLNKRLTQAAGDYAELKSVATDYFLRYQALERQIQHMKYQSRERAG